jgi:hypothetical protein
VEGKMKVASGSLAQTRRAPKTAAPSAPIPLNTSAVASEDWGRLEGLSCDVSELTRLEAPSRTLDAPSAISDETEEIASVALDAAAEVASVDEAAEVIPEDLVSFG